MGKTRVEAFSDGVLAVIITIMVLELKVPHSVELEAIWELVPLFLAYVLSFVFISIYWNNHHHLFHTVDHVTGGMLWANSHLLFWLSLIPFGTGWMSENNFALLPVITYGFIMFMAGNAFYILVQVIVRSQGPESKVAKVLGRDWKGISSAPLLLVGMAVAFLHPLASCAVYAVVAGMWFIPDQRFERAAHRDK